ncbi:hypothetical protein fugu_018536, partial [Takifugu bimaculatus]
LRREGYTVQVSVNDYLDIYCPHYNATPRGMLERTVAEQYVLYMVSYRGYRMCDPQQGFKRWECNRPHAPHAPIKFSEKFQRYSAFSLGYEFNVGQEYYYISTPTHHHGHSCLRLRVYVCCSTVSQADDDSSQTPPDYTVRPNIKIHNIDEFNPEVPKLEKSVSGSSPSHDRVLLSVATLLLDQLDQLDRLDRLDLLDRLDQLDRLDRLDQLDRLVQRALDAPERWQEPGREGGGNFEDLP